MKNWEELKSIRDIEVFLGFANLYQGFIIGFNRIAAQLISMLKTTTIRSIDASLTNNEVSRREEKEKKVERKLGGQTNFLSYLAGLMFT